MPACSGEELQGLLRLVLSCSPGALQLGLGGMLMRELQGSQARQLQGSQAGKLQESQAGQPGQLQGNGLSGHHMQVSG